MSGSAPKDPKFAAALTAGVLLIFFGIKSYRDASSCPILR